MTLARGANKVALTRINDDPATIAPLLRAALVVHNTVRRMQATAAYLRAELASNGIDVSVAHSRFLAPDRAEKDQWLRDPFGSCSRCCAALSVSNENR